MAKKILQIPLAKCELSSQQIEDRFGALMLEMNSGFLAIETCHVTETILLQATDSPQRILLRPLLAGKDRKKAKSCCDKNCSKCEIPMRSSATIGHFVERRIRKHLKKDKWSAKFFTSKTTSALDKAGIQVYADVNETGQPSPEQMAKAAQR
jgi:hypothetical protein